MNMTLTVLVFVALASTCFASPYQLRDGPDDDDLQAAEDCLADVKNKRSLEKLFGRGNKNDDGPTEECKELFANLADDSCKPNKKKTDDNKGKPDQTDDGKTAREMLLRALLNLDK